jgi:uncharacterized protein YbjT (DUF2867 family)
MTSPRFSIVMLGATGAVGGYAAAHLVKLSNVARFTTLGRRPVAELDAAFVQQHVVDVLNADSYRAHLPGHNVAMCTLGVGQPSKVSAEEFVKVDKTAALDFARACREAGVQHFQLLSSVGTKATSSSFYLRTKGELEAALKGLGFARLSIFHPSMILTPTNRYGFGQGVMLKMWPSLTPVLIGPLRNYRGIEVARLGRAIAVNVTRPGTGVEDLYWDEIVALSNA